MKCREGPLHVVRVTLGENIHHSAVGVFLVVNRVFGADGFKAPLAREESTRATSADEAHHTVGGMLSA